MNLGAGGAVGLLKSAAGLSWLRANLTLTAAATEGNSSNSTEASYMHFRGRVGNCAPAGFYFPFLRYSFKC